MKKNESKYFYTAELMNEALLALLEKKDIEFITVTEVTKKAGVNRSTFYLHYDDVYELLEETIENLNKRFAQSFTADIPQLIRSKDEAFLLTDRQLVPYLQFVREHKRVLRLVHQKPQLFQSQRAYKKMYDKIFYPAISHFCKEENDRIYKLEFFTGGVSSIVHKWLELDCVTPLEDVIAVIQDCIGYRNGESEAQ